jgi:predicted transcriptional regulator
MLLANAHCYCKKLPIESPFFGFSSYCRLGKLSKGRVIKALKELGLSSIDVQVYVLIARTEHQNIKEIALALNLPESKAQRSLKDLQSLSIVKASIEYPLEFEASPFEEVINLIIEVKKEQAKAMQQAKEELLSSWRKITKEGPEKS